MCLTSPRRRILTDALRVTSAAVIALRKDTREGAPGQDHRLLGHVAVQVFRPIATGDVLTVGVGPGTVNIGFFSTPSESATRAPHWGSRPELMEVLGLARSGMIHVETERVRLDDAPHAYERLRAGTIRGRAVIVPDHNQHGEDAS